MIIYCVTCPLPTGRDPEYMRQSPYFHRVYNLMVEDKKGRLSGKIVNLLKFSKLLKNFFVAKHGLKYSLCT